MAGDGESLFGTVASKGIDLVLGPVGDIVASVAKLALQHYLDPRTAPPQHLRLARELRLAQLVALEHVRLAHENAIAELSMREGADERAYGDAVKGYVEQRRKWYTDSLLDVESLDDQDVADLMRWAAGHIQHATGAQRSGKPGDPRPPDGGRAQSPRQRSEQQMLKALRDELQTDAAHHFERFFLRDGTGWYAKWTTSFQNRVDDDRALADQLAQAQNASLLIQGDRLEQLLLLVLDRLPPPVTSHPLPRPFDFSRLIEAKTRHFFGRDRLIAMVERWIDDPSAREQVMLLHAPFGVGKSALMAELCRRRLQRQGAATVVHFCRWDQESTLDPGNIVRSIAAQFARNLPAYAAHLSHDPGARALLEERAASDGSGSAVSALAAWEGGVLRPLAQLHGVLAVPPGVVHVLLVDGLDESSERTSAREGDSLLALIGKAARGQLPPWLRVIVASRPDGGQLFARRADFRFVNLLDPAFTDQLVDLRGFIESRCTTLAAPGGPLSPPALQLLGHTPDQLVEAILSVSDGLFLVAEQVFDFIESRDFSPTALAQLLDRVRPVPGIESFLDWSFHERVRRQGHDVALTRDVLGVIAAARDPLPAEAVAAVLARSGHGRHEAATVRAVLLSLGGLVVDRPPASQEDLGGWTFAHKSIEEWLDPQTPVNRMDGRRPAGVYSIDRTGSLRRIEACCLSAAHGEGTVPEFRPYLSTWGVAHLLEGGQLAGAVSLLAWQLDEMQDPRRPHSAYREQEAQVIEQLRLRFRRLDEQPTRTDAELARLDRRALQQVLRAREYETGKYQPLIRALAQYHGEQWEAIRDGLLRHDDDLVLRNDIGVAMARAWHAAPAAAAQALWQQILSLSEASEGSPQREVAGYAVKHICQRIDPEPPWWQAEEVLQPLRSLLARYAASGSATDRMVASEALLALAVQGEDVRSWVPPEVERFWHPAWPNQQAEVDAIQVLLASGRELETPSPAQSTVLAQQALAARLGRALGNHALFGPGAALGEQQALRETLWPMSHQQCGKDYVGDALQALHGLGERPEGFAFDLVQLLMLHPLWDIGEVGSNLLADLVKRSQGRRMTWVDALMATDDAHWRLRYGAVDAAFTAGAVDGYAKFCDVVVRAGMSDDARDPYHRVRGICADDLHAYLKQLDSDRRRAALAPGQPLALLLQHWLRTADDIWLLEYLHAVMHLLGTGRQQLPEVVASLLQVELAAALPQDAGRPFHELERDEFLKRVELARAARR